MATHELDYVSVRGFRSIASIEKLPLRPINVLIGANGSGKSNFIGFFSFLNAIRGGRLQQYVRDAGGAERILHFGSKVTSELSLELSFLQELNGYRLTLRPNEDDTLYPAEEEVWFWNKDLYPGRPLSEPLHARERGLEAGISGPRVEKIARYVRDHLESWRLYHVHDTSASSPLRKTARVDDVQALRPDGSNLPAFLHLLRDEHPDSYGLVRRAVRRVAPFFDDFVLEPDRRRRENIRLEWRHVGVDDYFNASSLSDGTLRFICLATLFLQPPTLRPEVILVDEPELGLHPSAITLLASLVKQAAAETQVILSTQSSLLLDHFEPEDVLVADRVENSTRIERLNSERLKEWLEDYSLGQLWEKNEIGGRPGSA